MHQRMPAYGLLLALCMPTEAWAFGFCSEPYPPSCATMYGGFQDQWEYDLCKGEMESYRSDVEDYISCRNSEAQEAVEEARRDAENALSEYDDTVNDFNTRVSW